MLLKWQVKKLGFQRLRDLLKSGMKKEVFETFQARRNENNSVGGRGGGSTNYKILSATMVGRRRKFLISNRLKRLEKLNICRRQVM